MTGTRNRHDITVTVDGDGGHLPSPVEFVMAAEQAASARAASVVTAHTADQIITVVTVEAVDRSAAVVIALVIVSEALRRLVASSRGASSLQGRI